MATIYSKENTYTLTQRYAHKHTLLSRVIAALFVWEKSPKHPIFRANIQSHTMPSVLFLRSTQGNMLRHNHASLFLRTTPDTKECHFCHNFLSICTRWAFSTTTNAVKATVLALIVQFCGREKKRDEEVCESFAQHCRAAIWESLQMCIIQAQLLWQWKHFVESCKAKQKERSVLMMLSSRLRRGDSRRRK